MKHQTSTKELRSFFKELSFVQEYDGKDHKCLRIAFRSGYYPYYNIYFNGKLITSTTNIKDAVKEYNQI